MPDKLVAKLNDVNYITEIRSQEFTFRVDEPIDLGGSGTAPTPGDYLKAALASCVAITLRMYANRKEWNLGNISVTVTELEDEEGKSSYEKKIAFEHELTEEQQKKLAIIADKCPISKVIKEGRKQTTVLV